MATRPPFKCAECRRDITAWFVAKFDWVDAQAPERDVAEQIAEIRLLAEERNRAYERDAERTAELYRQADEASRAHLERLIAEGRASYDRMIEEKAADPLRKTSLASTLPRTQLLPATNASWRT